MPNRRSARNEFSVQLVITVLLGIVSSFFGFPKTGRCDEQRTVAVIPNDAHRPFLSRLRAEIEIAGFRVAETEETDNPSESAIESTLRAACAFLFVREAQGTVALYYRTGDHRTAHLTVPLPQTDEAAQVTALHIAEVLRTAFLVTTRRPRAAPPKPPKTALRKAADALCGGLDVNVLFGHLGAPPQVGISAALGIRLTSWLVAALNIEVPFRGIQLHETEGDVRIFMGALGLRLGVVANTKIARPKVALGYQLWLIGAKAFPASGYEGVTDTQLTSGPVLYAGVIFMLTPRMGLSLGGTAAVTTNEIEYAVTTRDVAAVGRPILGVSIGIEWLPARRRR